MGLYPQEDLPCNQPLPNNPTFWIRCADVTGWFREKTVDNGNKLFAVCTPAVAEQGGADLSPVWVILASLLYHDARRSTPLESSVYRLLRSNECPFRW